MMISKWYESLPGNEAVRALVSWQWQSAPPLPFLWKGELWLYVPFQRVWAEGDELCCSPLLGEMWFIGGAKQISEFRNLCLAEGEEEQAVLDRAKMSESAVYRSNNALRKYLQALDEMQERVHRTGAPAPGEMEKCRELLRQTLLLPGQWALYEGMMP